LHFLPQVFRQNVFYEVKDRYENNCFIFTLAVLDIKLLTALQKVSARLEALMFQHTALTVYIYFTQRTSAAPDIVL
jgi:hypothetical protein